MSKAVASAFVPGRGLFYSHNAHGLDLWSTHVTDAAASAYACVPSASACVASVDIDAVFGSACSLVSAVHAEVDGSLVMLLAIHSPVLGFSLHSYDPFTTRTQRLVSNELEASIRPSFMAISPEITINGDRFWWFIVVAETGKMIILQLRKRLDTQAFVLSCVTAVQFYVPSAIADVSPHIVFGTRTGDLGVLKLANEQAECIATRFDNQIKGVVYSIDIDNLNDGSAVLFVLHAGLEYDLLSREFSFNTLLSAYKLPFLFIVSISKTQVMFIHGSKLITAAFEQCDRNIAETLLHPQKCRGLGQELMFDSVSRNVAVTGPLVYPPKNIAHLKELFGDVLSKKFEHMHINAVVYYLLKDMNTAIAEEYSKRMTMLPSLITLLDAFWDLDHGDFKTAVCKLTTPNITNPYANSRKILRTLLLAEEQSLATVFMRFSDIPAEELEETTVKLKLQKSIFDAITYNRNLCLTRQKRMLDIIFDFAFQNRDRLLELKSVGFSSFEEQAAVDYCRIRESDLHSRFIVAYYCQLGRFAEACEFYESVPSANDDFGFKSLMDNLEQVVPRGQKRINCTEPIGDDTRKGAELPRKLTVLKTLSETCQGETVQSLQTATIQISGALEKSPKETGNLHQLKRSGSVLSVSLRPQTPVRSDPPISVACLVESHEKQQSAFSSEIATAAEIPNLIMPPRRPSDKAKESIVVVTSPIGMPSKIALPLRNTSPFAKRAVTVHFSPPERSARLPQPPENVAATAVEKENSNPFDEEVAIADMEPKRQFRKTPARATRKSGIVLTPAVKKTGDGVAASNTAHPRPRNADDGFAASGAAGAPSTPARSRRVTGRIVAFSESDDNEGCGGQPTLGVGGKTRVARACLPETECSERVEVVVAKAGRTPRAKKTAAATPAAATPVARLRASAIDDPMTLEELGTPAATATKTAKKSGTVKSILKKETPASTRMITRRMSKLTE
ncbi:hypothetical protein HDU82_000839 [Entophlyctis luteolus]|nr:hypothetical protein HDU82_000839 [Entophlyctis luteolus]